MPTHRAEPLPQPLWPFQCRTDWRACGLWDREKAGTYPTRPSTYKGLKASVSSLQWSPDARRHEPSSVPSPHQQHVFIGLAPSFTKDHSGTFKDPMGVTASTLAQGVPASGLGLNLVGRALGDIGTISVEGYLCSGWCPHCHPAFYLHNREF